MARLRSLPIALLLTLAASSAAYNLDGLQNEEPGNGFASFLPQTISAQQPVQTEPTLPVRQPAHTTEPQLIANEIDSVSPAAASTATPPTLGTSTVASTVASTTTSTAGTTVQVPTIPTISSDSGKIGPATKQPDRQQPKEGELSYIVDLSHPLDEATLHWPKVPGFRYESLSDGDVSNRLNSAYYLKSDAFRMAVHCGTHLDAPAHFSRAGWTVDRIPLERLVDVPVQVFDLSAKVSANRSYSFQREDFKNAELRPGSVVLVYTGVSGHYAEGEAGYLGTDSKRIAAMRVPGFSREAAQLMVEAGVYGVGLDAPSADSSERHLVDESMDPVAHVLLNANNIYILENVNGRLAELVGKEGARLFIAPLPIRNGSGSPIRLLALLEPTGQAHIRPHYLAVNAGAARQLPPYLLVVTTLLLACALVFRSALRPEQQ